jgi:hypothetical protein
LLRFFEHPGYQPVAVQQYGFVARGMIHQVSGLEQPGVRKWIYFIERFYLCAENLPDD